MREMEEKSCGMRSGNNDAPGGSRQPPTYTDEQIIRIPEITCRKSEEYGYETIHWSLNQLIDVVIKEGIVESISRNIGFKNIGKFRPHLVRYWEHFFESAEDSEMLTEKVNEIYTIYYDAQTPHKAGGIPYVSMDEMTGIQVMAPPYPDKSVMPGKTPRMKFEDIRYGKCAGI